MRRAVASNRSDKRRAKSSRPPRTDDPQYKLVALPAFPVLLCIRFCGPVGAGAWRVVRGTAAAVRYVKPAPSVRRLASAFRASRGANPGAELGRALSSRATPKATEAARRAMTARGYNAHHIVASGDRRAAFAQSVLQRAGINPNALSNGVWLKGSAHKGIHTNVYYANINRMFAKFRLVEPTKFDVELTLQLIKTGLKNGTFPTR